MLFGAIHDGGTDESDCKIIYKELKYFAKMPVIYRII